MKVGPVKFWTGPTIYFGVGKLRSRGIHSPKRNKRGKTHTDKIRHGIVGVTYRCSTCLRLRLIMCGTGRRRPCVRVP